METGILRTPGGTEHAVVLDRARRNNAKAEQPATAQPATDQRREKRLEALQWAQLAGIVIAVGAIFMAIGARDQTIKDLKEIVTRLVEYNLKTQSDLSSLRADVENLKLRRQ